MMGTGNFKGILRLLPDFCSVSLMLLLENALQHVSYDYLNHFM